MTCIKALKNIKILKRKVFQFLYLQDVFSKNVLFKKFGIEFFINMKGKI